MFAVFDLLYMAVLMSNHGGVKTATRLIRSLIVLNWKNTVSWIGRGN